MESSKPEDAARTEFESDALQGDLKELNSRVVRLREIRAQQTRLLAKLQVDCQPDQLLILGGLADRNKLLEDKLLQLQGKLRSYEDVVRKAAYFRAKLKDTKSQIGELDSQIEALKQKREQIISKSTRALRFPREHLILRSPCWAVLKDKRLAVVHHIGDGGFGDHYNRDDFVVRDSGDRVAFNLIPGRGEKVSERPSEMTTVKKIMESLSSRKYSVHFAVYPDSFDELVILRNLFVEKGYDYNWFPLEEGCPLELVPASAITGQ
jgi:hypothetical protein